MKKRVDKKIWLILIGILIVLVFVLYFGARPSFSPLDKSVSISEIANARYCQCGEIQCIGKDIGEAGNVGTCNYKAEDKLCNLNNPLKGYNCVDKN